ncbi:MAG: glycoside hydrolase family 28 protein, partial [Lachnospira sp.]|nr:glycoside hydrolase family 28 protein [Lachnospira sp.]
MELILVTNTARNAVFELTESGKYYTDKAYEIYVNGEKYVDSNKVITSVYGLKPDTEYEVKAVYDGNEIGPVKFKTNYEFVTLNVREFGAYGDGVHDDTNAIQCAIMACPKDSRVLVPEGVYKISSIFLKDNLILELAENAVLSAFTDREKFPILPGVIESYDETEEYNLGSWEGNPLDMFAGIICGINANNVVITGQGTIDGCTTFENWWNNCKVRNIAWRPRLFFINHCNNVTMHGITVQNSPAWTIHPYFSDHLKFIDVKIKAPADSHNTDGLDPESCQDVLVLGTHISVGDDCIAIKSGKIYQAQKYKRPTSNMIIRQCCMQDGHGAITVGSEIAAGVNDVHI